MSILGLPNLRFFEERETWDRVYLEGEPGLPVCSKCGSGDDLSDPRPAIDVTVADTPSRGKPTEMRITRFKYWCRSCRRSFLFASVHIDQARRMTHRLIRYIEDSSFRRPRSAIAAEVGVDQHRVDHIVLAQAKRLADRHRFPVPRVLGTDDIKINKKTYTVFTDAETGHAIGLIASGELEKAQHWVDTHIWKDIAAVKVLVSDLGKTNLALAHWRFGHALHVGDPWHLMRAAQKAMSKIVSQELNTLGVAAKAEEKAGVPDKRNGPRQQEKAIRAGRSELMGKRKKSNRQETLFDDQTVLPLLKISKRLSLAFWTRISLARMYRCADANAARVELQRFYRAASHKLIRTEMTGVVQQIRDHETLVMNYFVAKDRHPNINPAAFTTSSTERRNGKIKSAWRGGRGVTGHAYLSMLALYEPWRLDVDIVECGTCDRIEGPVSLVPGLIGQAPDGPLVDRSSLQCRACRPPVSASAHAA